MNEQNTTKDVPARDNVTPGLAAVIVLGATVSTATPFWPQALGAPPPLGPLLVGACLVLGILWHSTVWWRDLNEDQRQIHRKAWWHGGNFGILLGAAALLIVLATGLPIAPQPLSDRPAAWALFGFLCLLAGQAVGYGVAWLVHRVRA